MMSRHWAAHLGVAAGAVACIYGMRFGGRAASDLGVVRPENADPIGFLFAAGAVALLAWLVFRVGAGVCRRAPRLRTLPRAESGVVLAELLLMAPVLLVALVTMFQIVLILNAMLVVRYSAFSAARAAIISLERRGNLTPQLVHERFDAIALGRATEAAILVCSCISPWGVASGPLDPGAAQDPRNPGEGGSTDPLALMLQILMNEMGGPYDARTVGLRVRYARAATRVEMSHAIPPSAAAYFTRPNLHPPREVRVRVEHDFYLTFSLLAFMPFVTVDPPEGMDGAAYPISAAMYLQSTGSRVHSPATFFGGPATPP